MSTEETNWDLEAAQYVLGTISDDNKKVYDRLYEVDSDWQRRVHAWQSRLNPLHASTPSVEPPPSVLVAVLAEINGTNTDTVRADALNESATASEQSSEAQGGAVEQIAANVADEADQFSTSHPIAPSLLDQLRTRIRYWQLATVLAVASVSGLVVLGPKYLGQQLHSQIDVRTVAVLQSKVNEPLWTVSYLGQKTSGLNQETIRGAVSITVVGKPDLTEEQSHQLWMVLPEGAGVQSVGLIPNNEGETIILELPIELAEAREFAVSIEPLGGVVGPEHGPVVARTFIINPSPVQSTL